MKTVRIGHGSAFWGDMFEPAVELVEKGNIDYIGFDHLAELTMALLTRMKIKDPNAGYVEDMVTLMRRMLKTCFEKNIKIVTNGGGANPEAGANQVLKVAQELGLKGLKIAVIHGDEIDAKKLQEMQAKGIKLNNLDTGNENFDGIKDKIVTAHAYVGSDSVIEALKGGANVVIAGRISDNAVEVGPLMYEFGWDYSQANWNKVAAAVTTGHIVECSACCTGGMSNVWKAVQNHWRIGYPIIEMYENGDAIITKPEGTGGIVDSWTVKEHLVYEVHDPRNYLMPDAIADFTTLKIEDVGKDRVLVSGMTGKARPDKLKVLVAYSDGFIGEGMVFFSWPDAYAKAKRAEEFLKERFKIIKLDADDVLIDIIGVNMMHGSVAPEPNYDLNECGVRASARCKKREEAEKIRREITHLWCRGPITGHTGTPIKTRPVIALWPTLVPREEIKTSVTYKEVK